MSEAIRKWRGQFHDHGRHAGREQPTIVPNRLTDSQEPPARPLHNGSARAQLPDAEADNRHPPALPNVRSSTHASLARPEPNDHPDHGREACNRGTWASTATPVTVAAMARHGTRSALHPTVFPTRTTVRIACEARSTVGRGRGEGVRGPGRARGGTRARAVRRGRVGSVGPQPRGRPAHRS
jgi:hypothetical protein